MASLYNPLPSTSIPDPVVLQTVKDFTASSEEGATRAAFATGNSCPQKAVDWAMQHNEDANFNDPIEIADFEIAEGAPPLFSFGVIADIQYADLDDGKSFGGSTRYFRRALEITQHAVDAWDQTDIRFIAQLGDLIDGRNKDAGLSDSSLNAVQSTIGKCQCKTVYSMVGNHELYNHSYSQLVAHQLVPEAKGYYSAEIAQGWRLIVLNGFDISTIAWGPMHPSTKAAWKYLDAHNTNDCRVTDGSVDWTKGLTGLERRWVPFNGAVGPEQLQWLDSELQAATELSQRVLVSCHVPIQPGSCTSSCLLWNFEEVLAILHQHGNVAAYLAGHDHNGGYARDETGVHHITFKSPLEAPPPSTCFATVDVHPSCLLIHGAGTQNSFTLPLN